MLVYLLSVLAVVSIVVQGVQRGGESGAQAATQAELKAAAEGLALSGIEIMATIANDAPAGLPFLYAKVRDFSDSAGAVDYSFSGVCRFVNPMVTTVAPPYTIYTPPLEYPPIRDVAVTRAPIPSQFPGVVQDNDIRLPLDYVIPLATGIPPPGYPTPAPPTAAWSWVPNTSPLPLAMLPTPSFVPGTTELATDYAVARGLTVSGTKYLISALQPSLGASVFGWWGPDNMLPAGLMGFRRLPTATRVQGNAFKFVPPSFVIVRDPLDKRPPGFYRWYIYCWFATRAAPGVQVPPPPPLTLVPPNPPPAPAAGVSQYLVTSGRVRRVTVVAPPNPGAGNQLLGPEVAVSHTQFR